MITLLSGNAVAQNICPVIPLPTNYKQTHGIFKLDKHTPIIIKDSSLKSLAIFLQQTIKNYRAIILKIGGQVEGSVIILEKIHLRSEAEAYTLQMSKEKIIIRSGTREGLFDGIITLLQLIRQAPSGKFTTAISCWNIQDTAKHKWRGLMLDESRHFFGKKNVKIILDWMAFYKLNRFHWHLTDQPGWRLEIKQYPKLTSIGGIGNHSDRNARAEYYTYADIREIVQYAAARFITIIPEIEMPGHATAANRAYPEFSGGGTDEYANFTFNPGNKKTYSYLTNILRETKTLFPSGMVHLGGDEVSFGSESWKEDSDVRELMRQERLDDLKAVEVFFVQKMAHSALKLYNKVLFWDEAADASLPVNNTIIFWWRHDKPEQLKKALLKGYHVVLCPQMPLYFDFVQDSIHTDGRRLEGNFNSLEKVYNFPDDASYAVGMENKLVLGIQANLWSETVQTQKRLQYLLFPRIAALSEAAWTTPAKRNYNEFLIRLEKHLQWYKAAKICYYNPFAPQKTPEISDRLAPTFQPSPQFTQDEIIRL